MSLLGASGGCSPYDGCTKTSAPTSYNGYGGAGGTATTTITSVKSYFPQTNNKEITLYVYVGSSQCYNGGGGGAAGTSCGGGATDIRTVGGEWNDPTSLKKRVLVAGIVDTYCLLSYNNNNNNNNNNNEGVEEVVFFYFTVLALVILLAPVDLLELPP